MATHRDTKSAPSEWGKKEIHPLLSLERTWCSRQSSRENSPQAVTGVRGQQGQQLSRDTVSKCHRLYLQSEHSYLLNPYFHDLKEYSSILVYYHSSQKIFTLKPRHCPAWSQSWGRMERLRSLRDTEEAKYASSSPLSMRQMRQQPGMASHPQAGGDQGESK